MLAMEYLFASPNIAAVSISFIEIYNEKVYDLLNDTPNDQHRAKGQKASKGNIW